MDCPKCKCVEHTKYGTQGGLQRYKCRNCERIYTVECVGKPIHLKEMALRLHNEGLCFRAIGRILLVSHVAAYKWIKAFGKKLSEQKEEEIEPEEVIEMDEIFSYVGKKKSKNGRGQHGAGRVKNCSVFKSEIGDGRQAKSCTIK